VAAVLAVLLAALLALRWRRGSAVWWVRAKKRKAVRPVIVKGPWDAGEESERVAA
jgi:hypothetical protein